MKFTNEEFVESILAEFKNASIKEVKMMLSINKRMLCRNSGGDLALLFIEEFEKLLLAKKGGLK